MYSGMTTVRPEASGTVLAGQLPVKLGIDSFDVNAKDGGAACEEAVQDATSSSGTVAAAHRRRRRAVRGGDIVLPL
jgi:hypothetical protein